MWFLHLFYFSCSHSSTVVKQLIERKRIVTVHGIAQKLESRSEWHREKERIHFSSIDAWAEIEKKSNVRISTLPIFPLILAPRRSSARRSIHEQHSCVLCAKRHRGSSFWVICEVHASGMDPTHFKTNMTSEISGRYFWDIDQDFQISQWFSRNKATVEGPAHLSDARYLLNLYWQWNLS